MVWRISNTIYIRVCHIFLDFKVSRYIEGYSFWSTYLRTLSLKFQKAQTKIEVVLSLPCWLSQLNWRTVFVKILKRLSLSLSAYLCIHFYWLSWLRQASHRKLIQNSALRLRLRRFKILTCPLLKSFKTCS